MVHVEAVAADDVKGQDLKGEDLKEEVIEGEFSSSLWEAGMKNEPVPQTPPKQLTGVQCEEVEASTTKNGNLTCVWPLFLVLGPSKSKSIFLQLSSRAPLTRSSCLTGPPPTFRTSLYVRVASQAGGLELYKLGLHCVRLTARFVKETQTSSSC